MSAGPVPPVWDRYRRDWPFAGSSRFVESGNLVWHVQRMGQGPCALLLHGTGSATHTWRHLMPRLARDFDVVAIDLPGHGFTSSPGQAGMGLEPMAAAVATLVRTLGLEVRLALGHSAGAAIAARMVLDSVMSPGLFVAVNGAFYRFRGLSGLVFPVMARVLASTPGAAAFFARRDWDLPRVRRLIEGTGSRIDELGLSLYARLLREPHHTAAALQMMAAWDLRRFERDLDGWTTPLALVVGALDKAVDPGEAAHLCARVADRAPCRIETVPRAGHLVHEEQAQPVADAILRSWFLRCQ